MQRSTQDDANLGNSAGLRLVPTLSSEARGNPSGSLVQRNRFRDNLGQFFRVMGRPGKKKKGKKKEKMRRRRRRQAPTGAGARAIFVDFDALHASLFGVTIADLEGGSPKGKPPESAAEVAHARS